VFIDFSNNQSDRGLFIIVEGNIGSGKSTFCSMLGQHRTEKGRRCTVFPEPIYKPRFKNLLNRFYKNQKRWALTFQVHALTERYRQHRLAAQLALSGIDVIQDRSIYADSCFGLTLHNSGDMDDEEWGIYTDLFGAMKHDLRYPDAMIYLRVNPEICKEKIDQRSRDVEGGIDLGYLQKLHEEHESLAKDMRNFIPVIAVDWTFEGFRIASINDTLEDVISERKRFVRDFRGI